MDLHHLFPKWAPVALVVGRRGMRNSGTRESWQAEAERDLHALNLKKKFFPELKYIDILLEESRTHLCRENYYKGVNGQNRPLFWTFSCL